MIKKNKKKEKKIKAAEASEPLEEKENEAEWEEPTEALEENEGDDSNNSEILKSKEKLREEMIEFRKKVKEKGVCYISKIPPYMNATSIRNILSPYNIGRVYLAPEDEAKRKFRIKKGGNRKRCFTEGWVEFMNKKIAKMAALSLNGTKMKDIWNIKYLSKFKWENLTEKLAYDARVRKEKLAAELRQGKKKEEFYMEKVHQAKSIMGIIESKEKKKKRKLGEMLGGNENDSQDEGAESRNQLGEDEKNYIRRKFKQLKPIIKN